MFGCRKLILKYTTIKNRFFVFPYSLQTNAFVTTKENDVRRLKAHSVCLEVKILIFNIYIEIMYRNASSKRPSRISAHPRISAQS